MSKTPAEIVAEATVVIDDLRRQLARENMAMKQGRISFEAYKEFKKSIKQMIANAVKERDRQTKLIKLAGLPDATDLINQKMQADFERRDYEKFMKEAGPALESALNLEETE